jgi:hypothetical protein
MQKLSSIIIFYRPFFFWSFAVNILLTVFNPKIIPAISIKLILVIFLWFILSRVNGGKVINLYKDVGISTFKLFGSIFLIDILITLVYLLVIKEFI